MKRTLVRLRNSKLRRFLRKHQKYAPIVFFIGGFIFDTLTLGRIDRIYDLTVLCGHMISLTLTIYAYNRMDDGRWKGTWLERYEEFFPLAIQFFFGGLSSAYVIYFSRSVSLSKTASFFVILIILLLANEFLKRRISNKYLQFNVYFFLNFTFLTFIVPVFLKDMGTSIFLISGLVSLGCTLLLVLFTYYSSPTTRAEVKLGKLIVLIFAIYLTINAFYFMKLIPPVPLALDEGIVAHNVQVEDDSYLVSYERNSTRIFWRDHKFKFSYTPDQKVYIFSSIFAPTDLTKSIIHRWKWYNSAKGEWEFVEDISYKITGGRDDGFRGYTYKSNVRPGEWEVEVITEEELVLGVIDFKIIPAASINSKDLVTRKF